MASTYRGTPITSVRLKPEIRQQLDDLAKETGLTVADLIRIAIMDFLDKKQNRRP